MLSPPSMTTKLACLVYESIERAAVRLRSDWQVADGARPRALVLDNLLPNDIALDAFAAFPKGAAGFRRLDSFRERKSTCNDLSGLPPIMTAVTFALQHDSVIDLVERITRTSGLEPDPSLYAGGLSMMLRGDFLNPHIDNSHDGAWHRYRRFNLLYYLTPDRQAADGGNLELWDTNVSRPVTIEARFNRLVIMETNRSSWHSVSPVETDQPRCCVSSYYFSEDSPDGSDYYHVTSYTGRPGQTVRRTIGAFDNRARQAARIALGHQRGRH